MSARLVYGLPFRDYIARPEVSHSAAWPALSSPLEARHRRETPADSPAMRLGRVCHSAALTPELYPSEYEREPDWRALRLPAAQVSIVRGIVDSGGLDGWTQAPSETRRSAADKAAWAAAAEAAGVDQDDLVRPATWAAAAEVLAARTPGAVTITDDDHATAQRIAPLVRARIDRIPRAEAFPTPPRAEVSILDGVLYGLPARCRLDCLVSDAVHPITGAVGDLIVDLKVTGRDITGRKAESVAYGSGYMAQLWTYRELYRQATGRTAFCALLWATSSAPHWTALQWVDVDAPAIEGQVRGAWTRYPESFSDHPAGPTLPLCIGAPSWAREE